MSNNNNNKGLQNSSHQPQGQRQQYYPQGNQRNYQDRRNQQYPYQPGYNDGNQRNMDQYGRTGQYPHPQGYYPPPYGQYPHPNQAYMPHGPMPNYPPQNYYYYPPYQYPQGPQGDINDQANQPYRQNQSVPAESKKEKVDPRFEKKESPLKRNSSVGLERSEDNRPRKEETPKREREGSQDRYSERSYQSSYEESEEEEVYYKRKVIVKKKDPVLDSKEEIRKWIQARRRNYPRRSLLAEEDQEKKKNSQEEMSILQKKIRKKLVLINSDPRSIIKKQKDLDILRRFILYPRKQRKYFAKPQFRDNRGERPLIEEIEPAVEQPILPKQPQIQEIVEAASPLKIPVELPKEEKHSSGQQSGEQQAVEAPIQKVQPKVEVVEVEQERRNQPYRGRKEELSVDVIINHLQMKQREDTKTLQNLMDYKSNSFQYRYQFQTLQTNLLLDNVFRDTSYMLQVIRYIVKNNFLQ